VGLGLLKFNADPEKTAMIPVNACVGDDHDKAERDLMAALDAKLLERRVKLRRGGRAERKAVKLAVVVAPRLLRARTEGGRARVVQDFAEAAMKALGVPT